MALKSRLAFYVYNPLLSSTYSEYSQVVESLHFTTVAPGGFGQLTCALKLTDARQSHQELTLFARVMLRDGQNELFLGEISDIAFGMNDKQEYYNITALGYGASLRDDPLSTSYVNQTAKAIVADQLARRASYNLPVDQDTSAIFPDNPTATHSPVYANKNIEDVVGDVAMLAGDYFWGCWDHPVNSDSAGFPTGQVVIHQRDTATTHYQAYVNQRDVTAYEIQPSAERAYNVVIIYYATTNGPGAATYTDPRLAGNGSQDNAPFRRRAFVKDLSSQALVDTATAQTIANTYGALFQNITNKVSITLVGVRDANGLEIPLWRVRADRNILIPEVTIRGQQLNFGVTPGISQFYIRQTTYQENDSGWTLTLDCDNYFDDANVQIARLQLDADQRQRAKSTTGTVQSPGAPEKGRCGITINAAAGATYTQNVAFRAMMSSTPTSITLNASTNTNTGTVSVTNIDQFGFTLQITPPAAGLASWQGTYQTVGN